MRKILNILKHICFYLIPVLILVFQYFQHPVFLRNYWFFYVPCFVFLIYTHFQYCSNKEDEIKLDNELFKRKFYFIYTCFCILFLIPQINTKFTIFDLNTTLSKCILFGTAAFVLYLLIVSDFHIFEISFGETKISLLQQKYNKEFDTHFEYTDQLKQKISILSEFIADMNQYCYKIIKRGIEKIDICEEYRTLIEKYFNKQNENVKVYILEELDKSELRQFGFTEREIKSLMYQLEQYKEIYVAKLNNSYYLFIPFHYAFEEKDKPVYILLTSETRLIAEVEKDIIFSLLIKFSDDLISVFVENGDWILAGVRDEEVAATLEQIFEQED